MGPKFEAAARVPPASPEAAAQSPRPVRKPPPPPPERPAPSFSPCQAFPGGQTPSQSLPVSWVVPPNGPRGKMPRRCRSGTSFAPHSPAADAADAWSSLTLSRHLLMSSRARRGRRSHPYSHQPEQGAAQDRWWGVRRSIEQAQAEVATGGAAEPEPEPPSSPRPSFAGAINTSGRNGPDP